MSNIFETRLKIFPNGASEYVEFKKGLTYANGAKVNHTEKSSGHYQLLLADQKYLPRIEDLSELQKLARRKSKVRDYVLSGNFHLFGTLTFRADDAHGDLDGVFRHKMILFTRMLRRRGVAYYIVAERHTGGGINNGKIHLHGLFSENLPTDFSPASKKYLHIPLWQHGFSSVDRIRDQVGTAHYVTKYISKEALPGRSVWVSQGLLKPEVRYNSPDLLTPLISEWYGTNVNIILRGK